MGFKKKKNRSDSRGCERSGKEGFGLRLKPFLIAQMWMKDGMHKWANSGKFFESSSGFIHPQLFTDGYMPHIHSFTNCGLESV